MLRTHTHSLTHSLMASPLPQLLQRIGLYNQHAADQLELMKSPVEYLMVGSPPPPPPPPPPSLPPPPPATVLAGLSIPV